MMGAQLVVELEQVLRSRRAKTATEWQAIPAAVLVPLYQEAGEWHLLYTRRTDHVDSHQGQVSFPGGAIETQDTTAEAAALREAHEEIGLPPDEVQVLGPLDGLLTVTQFHVTPIVGVIAWPFEMKINSKEVAAVFGVPLRWLLDEGNLKEEQREGPMLGKPVTVYYFSPFEGEVIWGVTARITLDLLAHIRAILEE